MPKTYRLVSRGWPRTQHNPPCYLFPSMKKCNTKPRKAIYLTGQNSFIFKVKIFLQDEAKGSDQLWGCSSCVELVLMPYKVGRGANVFTWSSPFLTLILKDSFVTIKFLWAFKHCVIQSSVISWTASILAFLSSPIVLIFCLSWQNSLKETLLKRCSDSLKRIPIPGIKRGMTLRGALNHFKLAFSQDWNRELYFLH